MDPDISLWGSRGWERGLDSSVNDSYNITARQMERGFSLPHGFREPSTSGGGGGGGKKQLLHG